MATNKKNRAAQALARRRLIAIPKERRREIARRAAIARWKAEKKEGAGRQASPSSSETKRLAK